MFERFFPDPVREQPAMAAHAATGGFFVEFRVLRGHMFVSLTCPFSSKMSCFYTGIDE